MAGKDKKPEIRFAGFTDAWKQHEFSSVVTRVSSISENEGLPRVEYEDIISGGGELNKDIYQKESIKAGIEFDNGDVLFGKLRPYLQNWFLASFKGIAVGDFWVLRANETNSKFIYYLIQTPTYQVAANQSSGTKMPRSDWNVVSKTDFYIPVSSKEQTQIGTFLKHLDNLITLHQRKFDKLVIAKKSMLEKMFPKDGANVPEIRFARFTDDWEQRKVGEIVTDVERPIILKDDEVYQLVTVKRRNEGVVSRGFLKGRDIRVKNYFEIRTGDYIISKRQVIHGGNGLVPENLDKSVVSNEYLVMVSNYTISAEFWTLMSKYREMYRMFFLSSYGVDIEKMVFNVDDWKKRTVIIPSLPEQNKIIEFFERLDNLITLHHRKLEKLKNIKKSLLDKMFV